MDLKRLEQFVAVADHGSLGKAARALKTTQPSLTRGIRALEIEIAAPLFQRTARGVLLTSAGQRFLPRARSILSEAERALEELSSGIAPKSSQVRLGVSPNFLLNIVPSAIEILLTSHPDINLQVTTGTREVLTEALRGRQIDLMLCMIPHHVHASRGELSELNLETLGTETLHPVCRAGHKVTASPATLDSLTAWRWAVPYHMSLIYLFESAFFRNGLMAPVQTINCGSITLIKSLVLRSDLLGMLPFAAVKDDAAAGRLEVITVADLKLEYAIGLIARSGMSARPPAVAGVASALRRATEVSALGQHSAG